MERGEVQEVESLIQDLTIDQTISLSDSILDSDYDALPSHISELEARIVEAEIHDMYNDFAIIDKMVPHHKCNDLADKMSSSVVLIKCWENLQDLNADDYQYSTTFTGFIINVSKALLIMTCAHFVSELLHDDGVDMAKCQSRCTIDVKFYNNGTKKVAEEWTSAEMVYLDVGHDICILKAESQVVGEHSFVIFGGKEYEMDDNITGLAISTVSHHYCQGVILPYIFTTGRMSQSCFPVPTSLLRRDCHCLIYDLCISNGSSGAPVFDYDGVVIALNSSFDGSFSFGIGLGSIRRALWKYFRLPRKYATYSANEILRLGLEKYVVHNKE